MDVYVKQIQLHTSFHTNEENESKIDNTNQQMIDMLNDYINVSSLHTFLFIERHATTTKHGRGE